MGQPTYINLISYFIVYQVVKASHYSEKSVALSFKIIILLNLPILNPSLKMEGHFNQ